MVVCPHCATPVPDGSNFCSHCGTPVPGQLLDSPTLTPQGREIFDRLKQATEGRYEVLRELGRGGMAVVFLGYQKSLDRQIAIKVLLPILAYDPEIVERFQREARTQGRLDHPSIISVYEVYNEGGLTFFTMPYISGRSLRAYLEDEPQPPIERVRRFLSQAADALAYAHRRGVVHRDVKPDNILIDEERNWVILTDFGIAKALSAETTLTTPGDLLGTPHYMSPEQGEGKLDLDGRADQYSLGLIGYEMLAGGRPFKADTLAELMYMHRFEEPESLDKLRPDIPHSLRDVIKRAMSKDRQDRFPTMEGFLAALEAAEYEAEEQDVTEPMPPPGSDDTTVRIPTPPGRRPVTPAPVPVDDTAPETTEPPAAPETWEPEPSVETAEPWAAPEPAKARAEPDTPPPWTPTPAVEPWARPEAAEPPITPEPAVGRPDRAERLGVGAVEVAAATERPRGVPRSLLVGGGTAAVLLVGALFLFGPLRSRTPRQPVEESVAETRPQEEQAGAAAESGVAERERQPVAGEAGRAGEVQVAGEVPRPTPPAGRQQAAGEVGEAAAREAEQTPVAAPPEVTAAGEPAEQPPAEATPVERGDPSAAQAARRQAEQERDAAARVVSDEDHRAALEQLDMELAVARGQLVAGRFDVAEQAFADLAERYEALASSAGERAAAEAAAESDRQLQLTRARDEADQARQAALAQRQAAIEAGADRLLEQEWEAGERAWNAAQEAFRNSSFTSARSLFIGLADRYRRLAEQAERERTQRELRPRVASARREMQQQRQAALDAGAADRAPERLGAVDAIAREAEADLRNERYAEAVPLFQQAADAYARLAEELAAEPLEEEQPEAEQPAEAEPPPEEVVPGPEEPAAVSPEAAINDLLERFRQAFEAEDLTRMGAEVYKGGVPSRDARFLREAFFDRARDIRARLRLERLRFVDGPAAIADVQLDMTFQQQRMRQAGTLSPKLRLRFVSGPDGWRLERLERR